jgi:hypothetical protein
MNSAEQRGEFRVYYHQLAKAGDKINPTAWTGRPQLADSSGPLHDSSIISSGHRLIPACTASVPGQVPKSPCLVPPKSDATDLERDVEAGMPHSPRRRAVQISEHLQPPTLFAHVLATGGRRGPEGEAGSGSGVAQARRRSEQPR